MTTTQKYIWATWIVPASSNLASYFSGEGESPYIHAFETEGDNDGTGFHITDEGAQLYALDTVKSDLGGERFVRFVLMVPDANWHADYPSYSLSPSELGGADAQNWGINTAEEIEHDIATSESNAVGA